MRHRKHNGQYLSNAKVEADRAFVRKYLGFCLGMGILAVIGVVLWHSAPTYSFTIHNPVKTEAKAYEEPTNEELVDKWAEFYGANAKQLKRVIACESSWREDVYGDSGKAYGLFQFHKPTFELFKKLSGMYDLDYYTPSDQIRLGAWAFRNGLSFHWTCK